MTYKYTKLTDKVLEQIKKDVEAGDMTSIEVLINEVTENNLRSYLSEGLDALATSQRGRG